MDHEHQRAVLSRYLEDHNLKQTRQREVILDSFLELGGHVTSEQLHQHVREQSPNIGYTTVYRTLKLFAEAGLAQERHFDDGVTRYEVEHAHHDHLVCLKCGRIIEFECEEIEAAQSDVAKQHDFLLLRHRHELYGHCKDCRSE